MLSAPSPHPYYLVEVKHAAPASANYPPPTCMFMVEKENRRHPAANSSLKDHDDPLGTRENTSSLHHPARKTTAAITVTVCLSATEISAVHPVLKQADYLHQWHHVQLPSSARQAQSSQVPTPQSAKKKRRQATQPKESRIHAVLLPRRTKIDESVRASSAEKTGSLVTFE